MTISLDNITFYSQPPPAKPPPCNFPVSCWKPYETPRASRALSRALPPRAPSLRTTITLASDARPDASPRFRAPAREDSGLRAVCNEFDIELERIARAQNGQVTRESDLTLHGDSGLPNGNDTDGPQDQRTSSACSWIPGWFGEEPSKDGHGSLLGYLGDYCSRKFSAAHNSPYIRKPLLGITLSTTQRPIW
ncbi:hypothetical protein BDV26DRAFT_255806 [Aspergillus bertholletiae]|uniref:Uncharacterized protein n=1 Tax=Aspergillus bertholletiae TaxID=1226010 RepID=A0A5N7BIF2_9EURO|nr:hypothetical protein BDV26DRAFT_255806 [Aspergillus bertholletiae]